MARYLLTYIGKEISAAQASQGGSADGIGKEKLFYKEGNHASI